MATKLQALASVWWDQVQEARLHERKRKIHSWPKMQDNLQEQFLLMNFAQSLYQQFHKLQQE